MGYHGDEQAVPLSRVRALEPRTANFVAPVRADFRFAVRANTPPKPRTANPRISSRSGREPANTRRTVLLVFEHQKDGPSGVRTPEGRSFWCSKTRRAVLPGSFWGHPRITPVSFQGHSRVILESFRDHSGVIPGRSEKCTGFLNINFAILFSAGANFKIASIISNGIS